MPESSTILIVDDSEFDRSLLARALHAKSGLHTVEAASAKECYELIKAQKIHLVLLDIMMPDTSGLEALSQLRKTHNPIDLPVIMITAKSETKDVVQALQLGANDYITKPVNFEVAKARILTHLKLALMSQESARLSEVASLHKLVAEHNHEINNALTIAISHLGEFANDRQNQLALKNSHDSLWRMANIIKKIRALEDNQPIVDITQFKP